MTPSRSGQRTTAASGVAGASADVGQGGARVCGLVRERLERGGGMGEVGEADPLQLGGGGADDGEVAGGQGAAEACVRAALSLRLARQVPPAGRSSGAEDDRTGLDRSRSAAGRLLHQAHGRGVAPPRPRRGGSQNAPWHGAHRRDGRGRLRRVPALPTRAGRRRSRVRVGRACRSCRPTRAPCRRRRGCRGSERRCRAPRSRAGSR
jgi:hypothetical protein